MEQITRPREAGRPRTGPGADPRRGRGSARRVRTRVASRRDVRAALVCATALLASACASFPDAAPAFSAAPALSPRIATPIVPPGPFGGTAAESGPAGEGTDGTEQPQPQGGPDAPTDPCAPAAPPVVASCLDQPWGLAVLPDGASALVGERTTGRILAVAPGQWPREVAVVPELSTTAGGGLLGLALSPGYAEDGLVYAYVTTAVDNRIVRIAPDGSMRVIVSGLPLGVEGQGGSIAFGADGLLAVATAPGGQGDENDDVPAEEPETAPDAAPDAADRAPDDAGPADAAENEETPDTAAPEYPRGAILRFDEVGRPAGFASGGGPDGTGPGADAVLAVGLVETTGMCLAADGAAAVVDHRPRGDLVHIPATGTAESDGPAAPGEVLWSFEPGGAGALDCALTSTGLAATARSLPGLHVLEFTRDGHVTGEPQRIGEEYGLLRTVTTGPGELLWLTTDNADPDPRREAGESAPPPDPADDKVIVLQFDGGGAGGGSLD